ncbi:hypothetical protein DFH27DRAFT_524300 [Peziza echinospora]|nr:hypothetical protein DFH27DRAFT_524300 [Peziza echinospora]
MPGAMWRSIPPIEPQASELMHSDGMLESIHVASESITRQYLIPIPLVPIDNQRRGKKGSLGQKPEPKPTSGSAFAHPLLPPRHASFAPEPTRAGFAFGRVTRSMARSGSEFPDASTKLEEIGEESLLETSIPAATTRGRAAQKTRAKSKPKPKMVTIDETARGTTVPPNDDDMLHAAPATAPESTSEQPSRRVKIVVQRDDVARLVTSRAGNAVERHENDVDADDDDLVVIIENHRVVVMTKADRERGNMKVVDVPLGPHMGPLGYSLQPIGPYLQEAEVNASVAVTEEEQHASPPARDNPPTRAATPEVAEEEGGSEAEESTASLKKKNVYMTTRKRVVPANRSGPSNPFRVNKVAATPSRLTRSKAAMRTSPLQVLDFLRVPKQVRDQMEKMIDHTSPRLPSSLAAPTSAPGGEESSREASPLADKTRAKAEERRKALLTSGRLGRESSPSSLPSVDDRIAVEVTAEMESVSGDTTEEEYEDDEDESPPPRRQSGGKFRPPSFTALGVPFSSAVYMATPSQHTITTTPANGKRKLSATSTPEPAPARTTGTSSTHGADGKRRRIDDGSARPPPPSSPASDSEDDIDLLTFEFPSSPPPLPSISSSPSHLPQNGGESSGSGSGSRFQRAYASGSWKTRHPRYYGLGRTNSPLPSPPPKEPEVEEDIEFPSSPPPPPSLSNSHLLLNNGESSGMGSQESHFRSTYGLGGGMTQQPGAYVGLGGFHPRTPAYAYPQPPQRVEYRADNALERAFMLSAQLVPYFDRNMNAVVASSSAPMHTYGMGMFSHEEQESYDNLIDWDGGLGHDEIIRVAREASALVEAEGDGGLLSQWVNEDANVLDQWSVILE